MKNRNMFWTHWKNIFGACKKLQVIVKAISAIKKQHIYNKCSKQCQCEEEKKINEKICVCTDREHRFLPRSFHIKSS